MRRKFVFLILFGVPLLAAPRGSGRYALILADPPVSERVSSRKEFQAAQAQDQRQRIQAAQTALRAELGRRNFRVTGSAQMLLNAVFVQASQDQEAELRSLPGVRGVVPLPRLRPRLDRAVGLVDAPAAWDALGGVRNAGSGVKIAIIDTGIDQTHPAFQPGSLAMPAGFPKCRPEDCGFTSNKVIVARSYVQQLGAGSQPNPAANSRPDDVSPRDRSGHGTAVAMIAAGETSSGPAATITGMAPQAYLGNYKVFGSPGINDFTSPDVVIQALEDALNDGMDIAVLSLGAPALSGPLDQGPICGQTASTPCDPEAVAVENAVRAGLLVVSAAGNEGSDGLNAPTLATIDSPGDAPSAISVAASTNSHVFVSTVQVRGDAAPANLQKLNALLGDGPHPPGALTAPIRDVALLGNNGLACASLAAGSLTGAIALIQRGACNFAVKVANAEAAGAVGVVIYQAEGVNSIFAPGGLSDTSVPAAMIGNSDGKALKAFVDANPGTTVTLDPTLTPVDVTVFNTIADFSSRGPSTGDYAVKPELAAVGTDLYLAAERQDPSGDLYDPSGYTVSQGSSFSTPMVAGAAALVKQKNPGYTAAQLKSALVNTATKDVTDSGAPAGVPATGAGKLDAAAAVQTTITVEPSTVSFGGLARNSLPLSQRLTLRNAGGGTQNLTLNVAATAADPNARLSLDKQSLTLASGQSDTVTVTLSGSVPAPGSYEGAITVQGGAKTLRVPYLYLVGDGIPFNIVPLLGTSFLGTVGQVVPDGALAFKLIDRYGVGVSGAPVAFGSTLGGGGIAAADARTDSYGIATAVAVLGSQPGFMEFAAQVAGTEIFFDGIARPVPIISTNGVVNAASFEVGPGIAPGSYVSIFGTGLSDGTLPTTTASLPLSLGGVSVSFDVPSAGLSLPGRLHFVSPKQVNVQAPWELRGQGSVSIKVDIGDTTGRLYTAPVSDYAPAFFEYTDPSSGKLVAALDENNQLISGANPARRGRTIQVFMNGLGPVDNQPATGEPAPQSPLAHTLAQPAVTVGGRTAAVAFSGLAPFFPALYQVNIVVPADSPTGTQPIAAAVGGVMSRTANLPVQ